MKTEFFLAEKLKFSSKREIRNSVCTKYLIAIFFRRTLLWQLCDELLFVFSGAYLMYKQNTSFKIQLNLNGKL